MGHTHPAEAFEGRWFEHPLIRKPFYALILTGAAYGIDYFKVFPKPIIIFIYVVAILVGGMSWFKEAFEELVENKEISIEFLVMAATIGSAILGMWEEAALLVILFGLAEGIEAFTFARARASLSKLLDLAPKEARVMRNGIETIIPAKELKVDEIFIIKPGESLPTDGEIVKGNSSLNEAPVTGESIPVEKGPGMKVFAASINQDGILEIKATTTFDNNTLSKLIHMVEEARDQKGKTQLFIEKFGRIYSPIVLLAAISMLVIPYFMGWPFAEWSTRAVVLLVAAAPCALIMSTPVAIATGIGDAGKNGVLIKGGMHLENLGKIKAIALDKTGTITFGKPEVTDIISFDGNTQRLLETAYSLEKSSTHPLAHAIIERAEKDKINSIEVSEFRNLVGAGIQGVINSELFYVGKLKFFEDLGSLIENKPQIEELRTKGKTVILVGTKERVMGLIGIQDQVRSNVAKFIQEFKDMGIKVVMLTGDNELTAKVIAQQVSIDKVHADLRPEDKIKAIEEIILEFGPTIMVGDGINDAPALARATVGVAMGVAGTDAAIEAADAALMGDDLEKLLYVVRLGQKARRIGQQNVTLSLVALAVLIPASVLGFMTITVAVVVHEITELVAVANGLRVSKVHK